MQLCCSTDAFCFDLKQPSYSHLASMTLTTSGALTLLLGWILLLFCHSATIMQLSTIKKQRAQNHIRARDFHSITCKRKDTGTQSCRCFQNLGEYHYVITRTCNKHITLVYNTINYNLFPVSQSLSLSVSYCVLLQLQSARTGQSSGSISDANQDEIEQ